MNRASLPACLRVQFRSTFNQSAAGIGDDELNAFKATFLQMLEEPRPPGFVLLVTLANTKSLPVAILIDTDRRK